MRRAGAARSVAAYRGCIERTRLDAELVGPLAALPPQPLGVLLLALLERRGTLAGCGDNDKGLDTPAGRAARAYAVAYNARQFGGESKRLVGLEEQPDGSWLVVDVTTG